MIKRFLYKYGSFEGDRRNYLKEILLEGKIFFSNPYRFNDPFDCRPRLEIGTSSEDREQARKEIFRILCERFPQATKQQNRQEADLVFSRIENYYNNLSNQYEDLLKDYGVYCLSASCENLLMWAHYGAGHTGYCLEFNASEGSFFSNAFEVHYQKDYPVINPFLSDPERGKKAILTKSLDWAYEKEWRLTSSEHGSMDFPSRDLAGVIFGCKTKVEDIEDVKKWIGIREQPIRMHRAVINDRYYKLDIIGF